MKKILLAVDFSPVGREVAHFGYRMAVNNKLDVTFLHCVPASSRFLEGYDIKAFISSTNKAEQHKLREVAVQKLDKILEDVIAESGKPTAEIDEQVLFGDAGEEILKYAKENDFDLIVIGYKSYSTITELLVGSTAAKVARYAPCSVMIYRPDKDIAAPVLNAEHTPRW